jgi:hypothetical protein
MNITLTRGDIITEALSQAARPDLVSNARLWLNLFLEKAYKNYDWHWLIKRVEDQTITQDLDFPDDYRAMRSATYSQDRKLMTQLDVDGFENIAYRSIFGVPSHFYADEETRTFKFWPAPSNGNIWNYAYYHIPELPDPTISATDLDVPVWHSDPDILIDAVKLKALYYNDDQRYTQEMKDIDRRIIQGRMNQRDQRAGSPRFKLGKSYRRRSP